MDTTAETPAREDSAPNAAPRTEPAIKVDDTPKVIYRQFALTRITHWVWAVSLFFLLLTGLQIFNAHPALYIGDQSGFAFENSILRIQAENSDLGPRGYTYLFG